MAYRYTNTDKWTDAWFSDLKQFDKLLFMYLCDNCDIAGFYEINFKRIESDLGTKKETIEGAFKGLSRGLIYNESMDCIYIKNFLKHQKNLPLNQKNMAHLGIIKRFDLYAKKFNITNIEEFINQEVKPLERGYGIGIGNSKDNDIDNWKTNFEIYKSELRDFYNKLSTDKEWVSEREKYHPNLDVLLSLKKACVDYWATNAGWQKKKASRSKDVDWLRTLNTALTLKQNQVYKQNKTNNSKTGITNLTGNEVYEEF